MEVYWILNSAWERSEGVYGSQGKFIRRTLVNNRNWSCAEQTTKKLIGKGEFRKLNHSYAALPSKIPRAARSTMLVNDLIHNE